MHRFQSDRKTRARQAMISICSELSPDQTTNASPHADSEDTATALYFLEVDSPFFQLSKETVLLGLEPLGGGGGGSGGTGGGLTARNTARSTGPSGMGGAPGGAGGTNKRRDPPKKAELRKPGGRSSLTDGEGSGAAAAAAGAGSGPAPLPETNVTLMNFFPRAAGAYPCRVIVKRRMKHLVDIRCVDIAAAVDAPRNATALVFRAPAGQKIVQEVRKYSSGEIFAESKYIFYFGSVGQRATQSFRLNDEKETPP